MLDAGQLPYIQTPLGRLLDVASVEAVRDQRLQHRAERAAALAAVS
jgi:hypothetical protein